MKKLLLLSLFTLSLLSVFSIAGATNITAVVNNGQWKTAATWSTGQVPTTGDVVTIPAGITVIYTMSNLNLSDDDEWNNPIFKIYGTFQFYSVDSGAFGIIFENGPDITVYAGGIFSDHTVYGDYVLNKAGQIYFLAGSQYVSSSYDSSFYNGWNDPSPLHVQPGHSGPMTITSQNSGADANGYNGVSTTSNTATFTPILAPSWRKYAAVTGGREGTCDVLKLPGGIGTSTPRFGVRCILRKRGLIRQRGGVIISTTTSMRYPYYC